MSDSNLKKTHLPVFNCWGCGDDDDGDDDGMLDDEDVTNLSDSLRESIKDPMSLLSGGMFSSVSSSSMGKEMTARALSQSLNSATHFFSSRRHNLTACSPTKRVNCCKVASDAFIGRLPGFRGGLLLSLVEE